MFPNSSARWCFLLLFVHFLNISSAFAGNVHTHLSATSTATSLSNFRLPNSLRPVQYLLELFVVLDPLPDFQRFTATGKIGIVVNCTENTEQIILHSKNLTINHDSIRIFDYAGGELWEVRNVTYDLLNDFLILTPAMNGPLTKGQQYLVFISFVAPIPNYRLNGMYQDNYTDPDTSETRYLATTLFAPYHARRLYPCFDEPDFRAEFLVTIGHHKKYHAMANEDIVNSYQVEGIEDYVWDQFATTPSISSYISAMIVSDLTFEEAEPIHFPEKTVRVYAAPHLISKGAGEYAANITDAVMGFFEKRFLIKYPLKKLYSVALPHFFFSAMENIGLITYMEPVLLYLKNETTEDQRYTINSVMSHELAHQWFGNIVACKWWAYVWLKEGFATFYSYYGMNHTNPELNPWEMFVSRTVEVAMAFDASSASHPLENFPQDSEAVAGIYTSIPYQKGASILRMTSTFLTENVFEEAIKVYVDRHQYASAEQNDLFATLQEALDNSTPISNFIPAPVKEIMDSWCQQSRFPLISVSRINSSRIQLTQKEFSDEGPTNSTKTWWVPINLEPRSRPDLPGTVPDAWMPQNTPAMSLEVVDGQTVIVNPDGTGYYRVKYDEAMIEDIARLLKDDHLKIPATGRSKLINDGFQLALAGYSPLDYAMELTKYLDKETSLGVWTTVQETMDSILKILWQIIDYDSNVLLEKYLLAKISNVWNSIKNENIGSTKILSEMLERWSCDLGQCLGLSEKQIKEFVGNPREYEVPADQQFNLYCSALKQDSNDKVLMYIRDELRNPKTLFGRKQRLLNSLTCMIDWDNIKWLLIQIFRSHEFVLNESQQLLKLMAKKPISAKFLLGYIKSYPQEVLDRFGDFTIDLLVDAVEVTDIREWQTPEAAHLLDDLNTKYNFKVKLLKSRLIRSKNRQNLMRKSNLKAWLEQNSIGQVE